MIYNIIIEIYYRSQFVIDKQCMASAILWYQLCVIKNNWFLQVYSIGWWLGATLIWSVGPAITRGRSHSFSCILRIVTMFGITVHVEKVSRGGAARVFSFLISAGWVFFLVGRGVLGWLLGEVKWLKV